MRAPLCIFSAVLFIAVSHAQETQMRVSNAELAYNSSTFFFQVSTSADGPLTDDQLRTRVGVVLREAAMHPIT